MENYISPMQAQREREQRQKNVFLVTEEPMGPWQLIEVPVEAGKQKIPLPDVQQLRSMDQQTIIIKGIRLVTNKVLANGVNVAGINAPLADLQNMVLVLFSEGWQKGQQMPVLMLNDQADADSTAATTIPFRNKPTRLNDWRNVDFPQSFLQYCNGQSASTDFVAMFVVEYIKINPKTNLEIV